MEQENTKGEKQEGAAGDSKDRNANKSLSLIEQAGLAAERLERANEQARELFEKQEIFAAQQRLGGRSEAGTQVKEEPPMSPLEYAKQIKDGKINPFKV